MLSPSARITSPSASATTSWLESRAILASIPVPTVGDCGCNSGTAWRCMFEPVKARSTRFFSMNGTRLAVEPRICLCEASINVTSEASTRAGCKNLRAETRGLFRLLFSSSLTPASAITSLTSWEASRYTTSSVTWPPTTLRYGVSMKPYSLIRA